MLRKYQVRIIIRSIEMIIVVFSSVSFSMQFGI